MECILAKNNTVVLSLQHCGLLWDGESSSPVIVTTLHCTQSGRSSQAWERDGEFTVVNR